MVNDFLDNLGARQHRKMTEKNATKEEIINTCEETFGKECYDEDFWEDYNNWYEAKAQAIEEYLRDQDAEQQKDRTLPPPEHFPYFP